MKNLLYLLSIILNIIGIVGIIFNIKSFFKLTPEGLPFIILVVIGVAIHNIVSSFDDTK